jgi:predicted membrane protein
MTNFWAWLIVNIWFCVFITIVLVLLTISYLLDHFQKDGDNSSIKPIFLAISLFPLAIAAQLLIPCIWLSVFFFCIGVAMLIDHFIFSSKKSVPKNKSAPQ